MHPPNLLALWKNSLNPRKVTQCRHGAYRCLPRGLPSWRGRSPSRAKQRVAAAVYWSVVGRRHRRVEEVAHRWLPAAAT